MDEKKVLRIWLADDDADDRDIFKEALHSIDGQIECRFANTGKQLMDQLDVAKELPDIIFLDINMPLMNGWTCLRELKQSSRYQKIPVIIYSTSYADSDKETAKRLKASLFFSKPNNIRDLTKFLKDITASMYSVDQTYEWN